MQSPFVPNAFDGLVALIASSVSHGRNVKETLSVSFSICFFSAVC